MTENTKFAIVVIVLLVVLFVLGGCKKSERSSPSEPIKHADTHEQKADESYDPRLDGPYWYGVGQ